MYTHICIYIYIHTHIHTYIHTYPAAPPPPALFQVPFGPLPSGSVQHNLIYYTIT